MQNARELLSSHSRRGPILLARPRAPDRARASLRIGWQRLRVLDARPPVESDQEGLLFWLISVVDIGCVLASDDS